MCLSVPGKVIEISGTHGTVDVAGNTVETDFSVMPDAQPGDWVLVHAGFAIQKYDNEEAEATLRMLREAFGGT
ncbi:MAG: HypC/HybG/HupF family hydrogenase formation chaperone [bacterium]